MLTEYADDARAPHSVEEEWTAPLERTHRPDTDPARDLQGDETTDINRIDDHRPLETQLFRPPSLHSLLLREPPPCHARGRRSTHAITLLDTPMDRDLQA